MKLGSFCGIGVRVSRGDASGTGKLGLFCIIRSDGSGEILNPNIEIRNKHEIRNMKLET